MEVHPLTTENIEYVFSNLSNTSLRDISVFGVTKENMKQGFIDMIGQPFTASFYYHKECCALLRLMPFDKASWCIYFVDRKDCLKKISFPLTRFLKMLSDRLVNNDGAYLEFTSQYKEGKSGKWFEIMGFRKVKDDLSISKWIKGG